MTPGPWVCVRASRSKPDQKLAPGTALTASACHGVALGCPAPAFIMARILSRHRWKAWGTGHRASGSSQLTPGAGPSQPAGLSVRPLLHVVGGVCVLFNGSQSPRSTSLITPLPHFHGPFASHSTRPAHPAAFPMSSWGSQAPADLQGSRSTEGCPKPYHWCVSPKQTHMAKPQPSHHMT